MYKQSIYKKFCFVALILCMKSISCQEDFWSFQRNHHYYCITNSTSALSWIRDNITDIVGPSSTFMVNSYTDNFEWKISINNTSKLPPEISKIWSLKKSLSTEVILDRRWEEMQVFNIRRYNELKDLKMVASETTENFVAFFSLRIAKTARIILCCNVENGFYTFSLDDEYLDINKWLHFQIARSHNNFTLSQATNEHYSRVIKFEDKKFINGTHMMVQGGDGGGLLKVHELEYLFTKLETSNERLGPVIQVSNEHVCISMLVSMCEFCEIKLTLSVKRNLKQDIVTKKYQQLSRGWQEVKVTANRTTHRELVLLVSTLSTRSQNKTQQFWAIDNIRQCQEHELLQRKKQNVNLFL